MNLFAEFVKPFTQKKQKRKHCFSGAQNSPQSPCPFTKICYNIFYAKAAFDKKAKGDFMNIDKEKIAKQAEKFGFTAVWFPVSEIPTNPEYLKYCEVNRCGNYRANYACPPDCGTPDEMRARLQSASAALVIQSQWSVPGYGTPEVLSSKAEHGAAVRRFRDTLRKEGYDVFAVGYGPCPICKPCKRKSGDPCPLPDQRVSCMSAYCVDVAALAARCALPFEWNPQRLYLFGMIMFCGE